MAAEVRARRWHLGFCPEVEARYEADQDAERRRTLVISGLIALLVYDLFLLNDLILRPEVIAEALGWRLGFLTPYAALVLLLVHRGLPARWREAAMASTTVAAMFASGMIFHHTLTPVGTYDPFAFGLVLMAGGMVFPLRFVHALASSLVCLLVAGAFVSSHAAMPAEARPFAIAVLLGTAVFSTLAAWRVERAARQSYLLLLREALLSQAAQHRADAYERLSRTDALTLLPNRRAFDEALQEHASQARRQRRPLSLLMVDVDHFKRYNDHFGHPAGDACLQRIAAALHGALREDDLLARLGGEEFVVLLPGANRATAEATAERLRRAVEHAAIAHDGLDGRQLVTVSLGVATGSDGAEDPASLMAAADDALYSAKRAGRNRWRAAPLQPREQDPVQDLAWPDRY